MKKKSFSISDAVREGFNASFDNIFGIFKLNIAALPLVIVWKLTHILSQGVRQYHTPFLSIITGILAIFTWILLILYSYGYVYALVKIYDTGNFSIFDVYRYAIRSMKFWILMAYSWSFSFLNIIFLCIPSLIWNSAIYFYDIIFIEKNPSMFKSYAESIELTDGIKFEVFLLSLTLYMIYGVFFAINMFLFWMIGGYCVVGFLAILFLHPALFFARMHAYRQLKGEDPAYGLKLIKYREQDNTFEFEHYDEFEDDF